MSEHNYEYNFTHGQYASTITDIETWILYYNTWCSIWLRLDLAVFVFSCAITTVTGIQATKDYTYLHAKHVTAEIQAQDFMLYVDYKLLCWCNWVEQLHM